MERDPAVFLLGEDVRIGGVFNATPELFDRFGPDRVIDTPISELAFTAAAFGAAVRGLRPVVEIMFADFLGLVIDTVANQASKYWYLSNEQASVPYTIRTTVGVGGRFGAIHSQTPTGWFMNLPGVKIVAPSNPADAKALLKAAIRDDNPVLVLEHKLLYGEKGEVADTAAAVERIGSAIIRRRGSNVTIVAALAMIGTALAAAEELAAEGIEAEVIDPRSLRPLDVETLAESAARTGRLVVVEEGPPTGGYASEVISVVAVNPVIARRVTCRTCRSRSAASSRMPCCQTQAMSSRPCVVSARPSGTGSLLPERLAHQHRPTARPSRRRPAPATCHPRSPSTRSRSATPMTAASVAAET
jgi:acetoin:2,6-dichlorophenolindophenol oxidoreductase subunit beta